MKICPKEFLENKTSFKNEYSFKDIELNEVFDVIRDIKEVGK